jgi:hypothetical protein
MPATKTQQKVVLFRSDRRPDATGLCDHEQSGVSDVVSLLGSGWRIVRLAPATPTRFDPVAPADVSDAYALAVLERDVA